MAFNPAPTQLFAGMSEDGTDLTIPIASIPELTAAEADAVTGDLRKVCYAIGERMFEYYNALAVADRPTKLTIAKSVTTNAAAGTQTSQVMIRCITDLPSTDVIDE